jgi:hypothetical protein
LHKPEPELRTFGRPVAFSVCILSVSRETTGNPQEKQQYPETPSQAVGKFDGKIEYLFTLFTAP